MIEQVEYMGIGCQKLTNGAVEAIVTTDVGPRIIRYALPGDENILAELPEKVLKTALGEWKPWGGHRLWTAPEGMPRSYSPDNSPVQVSFFSSPRSSVGMRGPGRSGVPLSGGAGKEKRKRTQERPRHGIPTEDRRDEILGLRLIQPVEPATGIQKEMTVTLDKEGSGVTVHHKIINKGLWAIEAAPWALTIMNGGGRVIIPQEPYISHDDCLLPARPMVLWHYTDLSDPRFTLGKKYTQLRTEAALAEPQKIGVANKQGWAGYARRKREEGRRASKTGHPHAERGDEREEGRGASKTGHPHAERGDETVFIKRFRFVEGAAYPDGGCNCETYTAATFIELETLGPMVRLEPGGSAEHVERWSLFGGVDLGRTEASLEAAFNRLLGRV